MKYYHKLKRCMNMKNINVFAKTVKIITVQHVSIVCGLGKNGNSHQILGGTNDENNQDKIMSRMSIFRSIR